MFGDGMPLLRRCLHQLKALMDSELPLLSQRMWAEGMDPALFATHWFNTVFSYSMPFGHLVRIWDVYMVEGFKVIFRVALTVVGRLRTGVTMGFEKLAQALSPKGMQSLLGRSTPDQILEVTRRRRSSILPYCIYQVGCQVTDTDSCMQAALKIPVSERLKKSLATWR